ncbi:MAG: hypothetical protein QM811_03395 [Pirellulales bacterium]
MSDASHASSPAPHTPIRILCVDDHPLVRKGIAAILANEPDMALVAEAENGRAAIDAFRDVATRRDADGFADARG